MRHRKNSLSFVHRGYRVRGCDASAAMLEHAREQLGPDVVLDRADLRRLGLLGRFDLVCCIDDGVSYLLKRGELTDAMTNMAAQLDADGLLLFDVNTIATYRSFLLRPSSSRRHPTRWSGRVEQPRNAV